jgi:hypothetical protein
MEKSSVGLFLGGCLISILLGIFVSLNFFLLLILTVIYGLWELWDEFIITTREEEKEYQNYLLFDPVYEILF